ncbi:MAG: NfeD family protein [Deltaproteobacteria bacterium]|nr:NfeD family protein [Deltaproteobacteria bacterium]
MPWWSWLILGFALLAGEMLAPGGFYLLFVGLGALIVGLLTLANLAGPEWTQWLLFTAFTVLSLTLLRSRLVRSFLPASQGAAIVGETVELTTEIPADGVGQARFRGSVWKVRNAGPRALEAGARCRVDEVKGITLTVGTPPTSTEEI